MLCARWIRMNHLCWVLPRVQGRGPRHARRPAAPGRGGPGRPPRRRPHRLPRGPHRAPQFPTRPLLTPTRRATLSADNLTHGGITAAAKDLAAAAAAKDLAAADLDPLEVALARGQTHSAPSLAAIAKRVDAV